jgi:hypothetical protein
MELSDLRMKKRDKYERYYVRYYSRRDILAWYLESRIVKPADATVARKRL